VKIKDRLAGAQDQPLEFFLYLCQDGAIMHVLLHCVLKASFLDRELPFSFFGFRF
jgi:hypothetical protein